MTDDDLFQHFQKLGNVTNCQVLRDINANSKQMGLVNFISKEQADNAIAKVSLSSQSFDSIREYTTN